MSDPYKLEKALAEAREGNPESLRVMVAKGAKIGLKYDVEETTIVDAW